MIVVEANVRFHGSTGNSVLTSYAFMSGMGPQPYALPRISLSSWMPTAVAVSTRLLRLDTDVVTVALIHPLVATCIDAHAHMPGVSAFSCWQSNACNSGSAI